MIIACYFLHLHDQKKSFFITYDAILEMLDVLKIEFRDFVPFENDPNLLSQNAVEDFKKFRDNQFIEVIETNNNEILSWKFVLTDKGKKRAQSLCKSVGIQVNVEIDIENPTTNKITINLYDRELMPVVDDLYYGDTTQIEKLKENLDSNLQNTVFKEFASQIENEIDQILMESSGLDSKDQKHLKKEQSSLILSDAFNNINIDEDQEEEDKSEDDDDDVAELEDNDAVVIDEDNNQERTKTLAQELQSMMCDNSNSLNVKMKPAVKKEEPKEDIDCEVILYVDNREKKN